MRRNGYEIIRNLSDFENHKHFKNESTAWDNVGFYINNEPTYFGVFGLIEEEFLQSVFLILENEIQTAIKSQDWRFVLNPKLIKNFLIDADKNFNTNFIDMFRNQINVLIQLYDYHYKEYVDIDNEPIIENDVQNNVINEIYAAEQEVASTCEEDEDIIRPGPKGVTNKQMIPALKDLISNNQIGKITILKNKYNDVYENSLRYLSKQQQEYLKNIL